MTSKRNFLIALPVAALLSFMVLAATPAAAQARDWDDHYQGARVERHDEGRHEGWYKHEQREPDRDDYAVACDRDGDDCRPAPAYNGYQYGPNYQYGSVFGLWR
jgi:hypothetical protein